MGMQQKAVPGPSIPSVPLLKVPLSAEATRAIEALWLPEPSKHFALALAATTSSV